MSSAGAKSVMSDDIQNITEGKEDISNRASGYKATLSNPSTSSPLLSFPFLPIDVKGRLVPLLAQRRKCQGVCHIASSSGPDG